MRPLDLLRKYYPPNEKTFALLLRHSQRVARKAVDVARRLGDTEAIDAVFVEEAALLHDIGILHTVAPELGCEGHLPYLCHGIKGREILDREGLPRHGLVCERHIGIGLSAAEIRAQNLPLPPRDMLPLSREEQIVAYADLFFSKAPDAGDRERSAEEVRAGLARFGEGKVAAFNDWHSRFDAP